MAIGKGWTYVVKGPHGRGCSDGLDVEAGKGMQRALASLETVTLSHGLGWGGGCRKTRGFCYGGGKFIWGPGGSKKWRHWVSLWRQSWFSGVEMEDGDGNSARAFCLPEKGWGLS